MGIWRCMSTMVQESNIPDDSTVNTFHVYTVTGTPNWADVTEAWQSYMDDLRNFFPGTVAETGHSLRVYDLADEEPRAPVSDLPWEFSSAPTGTTLPAEVALCISYEGTQISGLTQARRRGRMYIGPINATINDDGRPGAVALGNFVGFFPTFVDALNTAGCYFVVYSRVNEDPVQVVKAWADNAFDTQRRRGVEPSHRDIEVVDQVVV